jgi:hypothetical protein
MSDPPHQHGRGITVNVTDKTLPGREYFCLRGVFRDKFLEILKFQKYIPGQKEFNQ